MDLKKVIRPQPSERWAMYRLICPVVDAACEISGLEPFFEYSQPNGPNKRLSADIALIASGHETPVWVIEAKKYGRQVLPGMVDAYLNPGAMGAVTNGQQWIFKVGSQYLSIGPLLHANGLINPDVYQLLVAIIASIDEASALAAASGWSATWQRSVASAGPTLWKVSGGKGTRAYHEKQRFETLQHAVVAARSHTSPGTLPREFLDRLTASRLQAPVGHFEVNEARMIWWATDKVRGARLNLAGRHLELLVHNSLLECVGLESIRASIKMHDKNPRMSVLKAGLPDELVGLERLFAASPTI